MDLRIDELIVEEDRQHHIEKHKVVIGEVLEVVLGDYVFIKAKYGRWQIIGETQKGRVLSIIIGERFKKYTYGFITARPANRKERSFYKEFIAQLGGEGDEKKRK